MKSFSEICSTLPNSTSVSGRGASSVPPLIPERFSLRYHNGASYQLWDRVFCHDTFIFIYMISGQREVCINDCTYTLKKGEMILIPPYFRHYFSGEYRDFESLLASFVIPGKDRRLPDLSCQPWHLTRREEKTLRLVVASFQNWLGGNSAAAEETVCYFAVLLRRIQSIAAPELSTRRLPEAERPLLNRITAYLAANRHRHVTLAELSRELHVSGSTLRQTFRKKMNVSLGHYELVLRLRHGIQLLRSTGLSVAEIAERVGFSSANGFLLAIKRECRGATPKSFRTMSRR